jgi:hypothetical protein
MEHVESAGDFVELPVVVRLQYLPIAGAGVKQKDLVSRRALRSAQARNVFRRSSGFPEPSSEVSDLHAFSKSTRSEMLPGRQCGVRTSTCSSRPDHLFATVSHVTIEVRAKGTRLATMARTLRI